MERNFAIIDADTGASALAPSEDGRTNADERDQEAGALDIMRILLGWNAGREMKGLERRMNSLPEGASEELAMLETTLACGKVGTALQIPNLNKSEYGEMIKNLNFITKYIQACIRQQHRERSQED